MSLHALPPVFVSLMRPLFFRLAERLEHRDVAAKVVEIERFYRQPIAHQKRQQNETLVRSLRQAVAHVPFHRKRISTALIDKIERDPAYVADLPVMTKADVTEAGTQLLNEKMNPASLKKMKTGGSTGHSAFFYYDQDAADWSSATTWYCRSLYESWFNNKQLHFACEFEENDRIDRFTWRRLGQELATNRDNCFTKDFSASSLDRYLDEIRAARACLVHGHPSTLYTIALRSLERFGENQKVFSFFEPSGEVLYDYQRQTISKAFACKIVNRYGLAEAGVVAYQTREDTQSLRAMDHLVLFDELPSSVEIEATITTLHNDAMPLVRYRSGDLVRMSRIEGALHFDEIVGRTHDLITIGERSFMTHTLMDVLDHRVGRVQEFQITKSRQSGKALISVVPFEGFDPAHAEKEIKRILGVELPIRLVSSEELIRVGHRGKFRHLVAVED